MTATRTTEQTFGTAYGGNAAESYERYFVPAIGAPLASDLVEVAALQRGERVLDVACGTGVVARLAADRVGPSGAVAGLDINAGMLAVARTIAPGAADAAPIRWYETTAEAIPLPDESFEVVLCQLGLMFVPDKAAALREMRRVLTAGGRLLLSVPAPSRFFGVLEEGMARHVNPAAGAFVSQVFSLHEPGEIERLVRDAGFRDVVVRSTIKTLELPAPRDFLWQYVQSTPLAAAAASLDDERRAGLERAVVAAWQPWLTSGGLTHRQEVMVATGRK